MIFFDFLNKVYEVNMTGNLEVSRWLKGDA